MFENKKRKERESMVTIVAIQDDQPFEVLGPFVNEEAAKEYLRKWGYRSYVQGGGDTEYWTAPIFPVGGYSYIMPVEHPLDPPAWFKP